VTTTARLLVVALALTGMAAAKTASVAPQDARVPELAAALAGRIATAELPAPDGSKVLAGSILDTTRAEACLRTIGRAEAWPAAWLVVQDRTRPYDLVLRVALAADGTIEDPKPIFLTDRRDWDDDALEAAIRAATGAKPPRERHRNLVVQSFTTKIATSYVYALPKTGKEAKGLLALLPEGSLIREATAVDLKDGARHTLSVVLMHPSFVPADCATEAGRRDGHRDEGGILLVLAGEHALEDRLDITEVVREATGSTFLPRFTCEPDDTEPGAIDRLVDAKFEGRESVRLLDFVGGRARSRLDGLPVTVGIERVDGAFKLFAEPLQN
jgi:hypothetical protein